MTKPDLYAVLGVDRGASTDEIKQAYRKLALEHHPDVNPGDETAEERFKEISGAKEILLSSEKRKLYDEFGMDGLAPGFDASQARAYQEWANRAEQSPGFGTFDTSSAGGQGIEDLLSQLFGARSGHGPGSGFDDGPGGFGDEFGRAQGPRFRGRREAYRGVDAETELEVDFSDAVSGNEIQMRIEGREPLRVKIPRGARDGTRIRLKGQGVDPGGSGEAGDLYIRLKVRPHPFFRREGDDLHADLPVTIPELVLGADIEIPTPDGKTTVKIPPHSSNGQILRLPGLGATRPGTARSNTGNKDKKNRGHLFLHLQALLPTEGGVELDELVKKLADLYGDTDPRAGIQWERKK
jgi:curved DNA-binding protein